MSKVRPLTGGCVSKGGHNAFPSQIKERPPAPAPIKSTDKVHYVQSTTPAGIARTPCGEEGFLECMAEIREYHNGDGTLAFKGVLDWQRVTCKKCTAFLAPSKYEKQQRS